MNGSQPTEGLVQVHHRGMWGYVLAEWYSWVTYEDYGELLCRQLGHHTEGTNSYRVSSQLFGVVDVDTPLLTIRICDENETLLQRCQSTLKRSRTTRLVPLAVVCNGK